MAIKGYENKTNQINNLSNVIKLFSALQDDSGTEKRLSNKMISLSNQIKNSNSLDSLANIKKSIYDFNQESSNAGYDEFSLENMFSEKEELFNNAYNSLESAKMYQDENAGDQDQLYNKIMGYTWGEATNELDNLYGMLDNINQGVKNNFNYQLDEGWREGKYSRMSLGKSVEKRIGQIENKLDVFAENEGQFLVYDVESGEMDENSLAMYQDLQFKILSGDTKDFDQYFDNVTTDISRKFQIQEKGYNDWLQVYAKSKSKNQTVSELSGDNPSYTQIFAAEGLSNNSYVDPAIVKRILENYRTNAVKYNYQHKVLTNQKYNDNPLYSVISPEDPAFVEKIPGTLGSNAKTSDDNKKISFKENIEDGTTKMVSKDGKIVTINPLKKQTTDFKKMSLNEIPSNIIKEGDNYKVYNEESDSYVGIPKENMAKIVIKGKLQNIPVIRATKNTKTGKGGFKTEQIITHIFVDGKWKKASVSETKTNSKEERSRKLKGGSIDFKPMPMGRINRQKEKEQDTFFNALAKILSR